MVIEVLQTVIIMVMVTIIITVIDTYVYDSGRAAFVRAITFGPYSS